jgi:hypothetical protein
MIDINSIRLKFEGNSSQVRVISSHAATKDVAVGSKRRKTCDVQLYHVAMLELNQFLHHAESNRGLMCIG